MSRKRVLVYLGGLTLLGALVYSAILLQSRRAEVPIEHLLAHDPMFPRQWEAVTVPVRLADWQISQTNILLAPKAKFHALSEARRVWTDNGSQLGTPAIRQYVYQYKNPVIAKLHYWLSRPEWAYYGDWPNFDRFLFNDPGIYPSAWPAHATSADEKRVVCAVGGVESCQHWVYWGRYGQYILMVQLFAPNQGADSVVFQQVVEEIDTHVSKYLVHSTAGP